MKTKEEFSMQDFSRNAYGIPKFTEVKCRRCKNTMKVGGTGSGFCSFCDGFVLGRSSKDVSSVLIRQSRVIPAPAEWVK